MHKLSLSKRVGNVIAKYRKSEGYTQAKLSELMNIEKETLSRIETGKISPSLDRIEQIATLLNRPVYDFFIKPDDLELEKSIFEVLKDMNEQEKQYVKCMVRELIKLRYNMP